MSNDAKIVDQNSPPVIQDDQAHPIASTGLPNKEVEPAKVLPATESIKPTETEPKISQDLKDLGVEAKKEGPDLGFKPKGIEVDHAGPHVPVSTTPSGKIKMQMSEKEIEKQLAGPSDKSSTGLAKLWDKVTKVAKLLERRVGV